MFEQSMIPKGNRNPWTVGIAAFGQLLALGLIFLIPLVFVQALPTAGLVTMLVAPPPPPPPPPPPASAAAQPRHVPVVRHFDVNALVAPMTIPKQVLAIQDVPAVAPTTGVAGGVPGGVPGGVDGGQPDGVLGSILNSVPSPAPPPPPPPASVPPPAAATPKIIHIGGQVEAARLIDAPQPVYPTVAKEARVQGVVELTAVIGKDGRVENLTVVSGNPLLVNAAMDAVKRWVYRPTYLNGQPVKVDTEIDVHFQLG